MGIRSFISKIQEKNRIAKPRRGLQNDRRNNCQSPADFQKVRRALYARGQNEKNQGQGPGFLELVAGLEPATYALRVRCSTY